MPDTLELGTQHIEVASLHESPQNPRTIKGERFEALKRSITQDPDMLMARPVIALPTGEVVAGNMRLRAAKELGLTEIPVFVADLDPAQVREWMLRDNQPYGEYVPDQLAELMKLHAEEGGDMDMLGFADEDVTNILKSLDEGAPVIPEPEDQLDPELKGEVMIEIYSTREAYETHLLPTLGSIEGIEGVEVNITS